MDKLTQEEVVLQHLKKHKKITSWQAIVEYRITRLAVMIQRLKLKGHSIITVIKNGQDTKFAEYRLIKGKK
jgi:hypothetical protein